MRFKDGLVGLAVLVVSTAALAEPATGLRMQRGGAVPAFVANTSDGVLIVVPEIPPERLAGLDGKRFLPFGSATARVLYCPSGVLDPVTKEAGPDCVADLASLRPGPRAFAGEGRLDGTVGLDPSDVVTCPTSLEVSASVRSPGGDPFDLNGSFLLSSGREGCREVRGGVRIAYGATPGEGGIARTESAVERELGRLSEIDAERWLVIDRLARLDDGQWETLRWLLALEPERLEQLDAYYVSGAADPTPLAGMVLPNGTIFAPGDPVGEEFVATGLPDIVNAIRDIVVNIRARTADLQSKITFKIPQPPVGMVELASAIPLDRMVQMIQDVRRMIEGVMDTIAELREGYDDWVGEGCPPASGCGQFKARMTGVFDDVGEAWCKAQHLACLDNPDLVQPRPLKGFGEGELFRKLLVDKPPPALLYALHRFLDLNGGWDTAFREINDRLPSEVTQLCSTCMPGCACTGPEEGTLSVSAEKAIEPRDLVVCRVTAESDASAFRILKAYANSVKFVFDVASNFTNESVVIGANVTVVGGGGATLPIDNPGNSFLQVSSLISEAIANLADSAIDRKGDCLDLDNDIEGELRGCEAPRSIFRDSLGAARLDYVRDRVDRWIKQADEGVVDRCRAECFLHRFDAEADTLPRNESYGLLCDAYGELILIPRNTGDCSDPDPSDDCAPGNPVAPDETARRRVTVGRAR